MITNAKPKDDRPQIKMLRLLRLIDRLAGFAYPKSVGEIFDTMRDEYKCARTVYRDVQLLETMGIVHHVGNRPIQFGREERLYLINLNRSERLQEVAIAIGGDA